MASTGDMTTMEPLCYSLTMRNVNSNTLSKPFIVGFVIH